MLLFSRPKPEHLAQQLRHRSTIPVWKPETYEKLLEERDIRVLIIKPGTGHDICECSLRKVSLEDPNTRFEALSYMWGKPGSFDNDSSFIHYFIYLEGERFDVTENLFWALSHLRFSDRERILWVDAVCINQKDFEERGKQVKLMGSLYTKAEKVLVDLGATRSDLRSHLGYSSRTQSSESLAVDFILRASQQENPEDWLQTTFGSPQFLIEWRSVVDLFLLNYWSRIWIIQEIGLAKKLDVYYGTGRIEWHALCLVHRAWKQFLVSISTTKLDTEVLKWFTAVRFYSTNRITKTIFNIAPNEALRHKHLLEGASYLGLRRTGPWDLEESIRRQRTSNSSIQLLDLLSRYFRSFSTDPKDKIYGLLGLANDSEIGRYKVDYSVTDRESLLHLVEFMLEMTGKLDILCYASFHKGLPTWVPFWGPRTATTLKVIQPIGLDLMSPAVWSKFSLTWPKPVQQVRGFTPLRHPDLMGFLDKLTINAKFNAAGDSKAEACIEKLDSTKPILVATGCVVDEVVGFLNMKGKFRLWERNEYSPLHLRNELKVEPELAEYADLLRTPSTWLQEDLEIQLSEIIKGMLAKYLLVDSPVSGQSKISAFLQTLTCNRTQSGRVAGNSWRPHLEVLLRNGRMPPSSLSADLTKGELLQSRKYVQEFLDYVHTVLETPVTRMLLVQRKLYVTKMGLIGLGEPHAKIGDVVCVIKGCFRPILLKRKAETWAEDTGRVIEAVSHGCTYLHDYMDGRAILEMKSNVLETCTFRLA